MGVSFSDLGRMSLAEFFDGVAACNAAHSEREMLTDRQEDDLAAAMGIDDDE